MLKVNGSLSSSVAVSVIGSDVSSSVETDCGSAIGGEFGIGTSATLTFPVSAVELAPSLSVTIRLKVRVSPDTPTEGEVNDGVEVLSPVRRTLVPTV